MARLLVLTLAQVAAVSRTTAHHSISNPALAADIVLPADVVATTVSIPTILGPLTPSSKSMNVILQLALNYLKSHPEVVEKLLAEFFDAIIAELKARNQ